MPFPIRFAGCFFSSPSDPCPAGSSAVLSLIPGPFFPSFSLYSDTFSLSFISPSPKVLFPPRASSVGLEFFFSPSTSLLPFVLKIRFSFRLFPGSPPPPLLKKKIRFWPAAERSFDRKEFLPFPQNSVDHSRFFGGVLNNPSMSFSSLFSPPFRQV